jgi:hypothetical protein
MEGDVGGRDGLLVAGLLGASEHDGLPSNLAEDSVATIEHHLGYGDVCGTWSKTIADTDTIEGIQ